MFQYRKASSRHDVAAMFGAGLEVISNVYVEDPDSGDLLVPTGGLGPDKRGRIYLLRWRGRTLGLHATVTPNQDEHGAYPLFTLEDLGTSVYAVNLTRVARVHLTPDEAPEAWHVAAEACVVLESYRGGFGPGTRVSDPNGSGREMSPVDFGYPEIARAPLGVR